MDSDPCRPDFGADEEPVPAPAGADLPFATELDDGVAVAEAAGVVEPKVCTDE
jgi:hypothetical protein